MRGTPHVHALVAARKDGIVAGDLTSPNEVDRKAVCDLVSKTITCCLQHVTPEMPTSENDEEKLDYRWRPIKSSIETAEDYASDVRRLVFSSTTDFRLDENNEFVSPATKWLYYQYQCANQMHICMDTCWKYSYSSDGEKKCRFHYPVPTSRANNSTCCIYTLYDSKKRKQTKINAPRNNGWVNPLPRHPLPVFANQGNMDVQYISNTNGAVEYTCGYISKNEEPDQKAMINVFTKKLAQAVLHNENNDPTRRQRLTAAGTAMASSQHVSTVQCAYTMLGLPFVLLSRTVQTISPLPTSQLTKSLITDMKQLEQLNPKDSTVSTSAKSHVGRRLAYHLLCQKQYTTYGVCNVSLYTVVSTYAISKPKRIKKDGSPAATTEPKHLTINEIGKCLLLLIIIYCSISVKAFLYT